jgi:biotin synthase-like enzyme
MKVFMEQRKRPFHLVEKCVPFLIDAALAAKATLKDRREMRGAQEVVEHFFCQSAFPLFSYIEIETINRCNNDCAFCPVNRNDDPRPKAVMDDGLLRAIVSQLQDIDY